MKTLGDKMQKFISMMPKEAYQRIDDLKYKYLTKDLSKVEELQILYEIMVILHTSNIK